VKVSEREDALPQVVLELFWEVGTAPASAIPNGASNDQSQFLKIVSLEQVSLGVS